LSNLPEVAPGDAITHPTQLYERYLLSQLNSEALLIDQQAAHERILYERYLQPPLDSEARSA